MSQSQAGQIIHPEKKEKDKEQAFAKKRVLL
jgi:hypothetical protein